MRKQIAAALMLLCLLSGCTNASGADRIVQVQELYAALASYEGEVTVELVREDANLRYTFRIEGSEKGTTIEVSAPQTLAGIRAQLSSDGLTLEYDGLVLDALSLSESISAANCVPLTLRALAGGYLLEQNKETFGETEGALRAVFESECSGEKLSYAVWLSPENIPLYAEIIKNEQIIMMIEFTDFTFGDIIAAE